MLINTITTNKNFIVTLDLSIKEIRVLNKNNQEIEFIRLGNDDIEGYNYLFNEDLSLFLNTLKEDILSFMGLEINDLEVLK
jgi:hypothetical protein